MSTPHPTTLAFDDVVIDFVGRRLLRGGEPQALEPKAFGVLALLTGAPGQAFARDDILDAVWGHRHVTPGVLNRVMTLLRHALGEDAHTPRYLHTLHGIGYRFDLPAGSAVTPAQSDEQTLLAAPDVTSEPLRRRAEDHPLPASALRRRRGWLMLIALAALAGAALWFGQRDPATPQRSASVEAARAVPTLIVIPLKAIGNAPHDDDVAAGLSEELIGTLARIDGLRVIARESTTLATAQPANLAQLAQRLGISHALEGSLQQVGEHLRIRMRLIDAASGRALWAQDYDRDVADVLAVEREIANAVAASLTLKLGLPSTLAAKGGDAEFHRRYQKAWGLLRGDPDRTADTIEHVEAEFRALAKLRPDDARAHAGLAFALNTRAFRRPPLAEGLRAEALQEAALAIRLDPGLPEPYHVLATAACRNNEWQRCLSLHRKTMAQDPSQSTSHFQYAMALASLGYLEDAREVMQRGAATDPLNRGWHYGHGRVLDTLGEHEAARLAFERARDFNRYGPWFNAVWRKDYADARRHAEAMDDSPRDQAYGPMLQKSYLAATRALVDAEYWPQAEAAALTFERKTGMMDFIRVLQPHADAAALIDDLDVLRRRSYSTWDLLLWTKDLAYLRRASAFQDYLRRNGILDYWKQHGYPPQCRPLTNGATCA